MLEYGHRLNSIRWLYRTRPPLTERLQLSPAKKNEIGVHRTTPFGIIGRNMEKQNRCYSLCFRA